MLNIMKDMDIAVGSDGYGLSFDRSITITDPPPPAASAPSPASCGWCGSTS